FIQNVVHASLPTRLARSKVDRQRIARSQNLGGIIEVSSGSSKTSMSSVSERGTAANEAANRSRNQPSRFNSERAVTQFSKRDNVGWLARSSSVGRRPAMSLNSPSLRSAS